MYEFFVKIWGLTEARDYPSLINLYQESYLSDLELKFFPIFFDNLTLV